MNMTFWLIQITALIGKTFNFKALYDHMLRSPQQGVIKAFDNNKCSKFEGNISDVF